MRVGIVYDPVYLKHDTGKHVENPARLARAISCLEQANLMSRLIPISPRPASGEELALVHYDQHIQNIRSISVNGGGLIDLDTVVSKDSFESAIFAAGGAIRAAESVMEEKTDQAFVLVRPPGHHATPDRAMGFCLFNNIAVTARYLLEKYGLKRLAIIDFDVHHGNGTQAAFETDPRVLYISTHQHPLYPGSGHIEDRGSGEAAGSKINIPLPAGCGDAEYKIVFQRIVTPAIKRFQPQFILVSAGYDSHWSDNIANMEVSVAGFVEIVKIIKGLAGEMCHNRLVLILEGGYNLEALSASILATFKVLLGDDNIEDPLGLSPHGRPAPNISLLVGRIRDLHSLT